MALAHRLDCQSLISEFLWDNTHLYNAMASDIFTYDDESMPRDLRKVRHDPARAFNNHVFPPPLAHLPLDITRNIDYGRKLITVAYDPRGVDEDIRLLVSRYAGVEDEVGLQNLMLWFLQTFVVDPSVYRQRVDMSRVGDFGIVYETSFRQAARHLYDTLPSIEALRKADEEAKEIQALRKADKESEKAQAKEQAVKQRATFREAWQHVKRVIRGRGKGKGMEVASDVSATGIQPSTVRFLLFEWG